MDLLSFFIRAKKWNYKKKVEDELLEGQNYYYIRYFFVMGEN